MRREEEKELNELQLKIENWFVRVNENDYERKQLRKEKNKLLKQLNALEEKYSRRKKECA